MEQDIFGISGGSALCFSLPIMRRRLAGIVFVAVTPSRHTAVMRGTNLHGPLARPAYGRVAGNSAAMPRTAPDVSHGAVLALLGFAAFFLSWRVLRLSAINITASDVALLMCAAILIVRGQLNPLPFGNLTLPWILGLSLMLAGLLISTLAHGEVIRWAIVGTQYGFAFALVPMVLMSADRSWLRRCAVLFVIGVAVSQVIGIAAASFLDVASTSISNSPGFVTPTGRVGSMSGEPNPNGAICAFAFPLLINAVQRRQMSWKLALPCGISILWGLLSSGSFTGFAAAAIGVAIVVGMSGMGAIARFGIPALLLATAYIALGGPVPEIFSERVIQALVTGDPSKAGTYPGRSALIAEAWDLAEGNMLLGLGSDGYREASVYGAPTHMLHLLILNEGGIIAFLGLETMLAVMIVLAFLIYRESRTDGAMCLAVVAVFLIFSMSIPHMYTRVWIVPVLLAFACAIAPARPTRAKRIAPPQSARRSRPVEE